MKKRQANYLEGILSIVINIFIAVIKFLIGTSINSIALITDSWHTFSDSFSSVIVIISTKLSSKPSDKEHPYGHGRSESIGSLVISFFLFFIAFLFFKKALFSFFSPNEIHYNKLVIIVIIISASLKTSLSLFALILGKKTDSKILIADGWHHLSDVFTDILILVGISLNKIIPNVDSILGLIISIMIFKVGFEIFNSTISSILGEAPSEKLLKKIKKEIHNKFSTDLMPHHFHFHKYGDHKEISFHILLSEEKSIKDAHKITDIIEDLILKKFDIYATIHVEPKKNEIISEIPVT